MIKKAMIFLTVTLFLLSCNKEEGVGQIDYSEIKFDFSEMKIDMNTAFDRSDYEFDVIVKQLTAELFEMELEKKNLKNGYYFSGYNMTITPSQYLVKPIYGTTPVNPTGDDKKCGGQEGDGWKSYGTCSSEACVQNKLVEASEDLSGSLGNGDCLDLRVKRNLLGARVCDRVISC